MTPSRFADEGSEPHGSRPVAGSPPNTGFLSIDRGRREKSHRPDWRWGVFGNESPPAATTPSPLGQSVLAGRPISVPVPNRATGVISGARIGSEEADEGRSGDVRPFGPVTGDRGGRAAPRLRAHACGEPGTRGPSKRRGQADSAKACRYRLRKSPGIALSSRRWRVRSSMRPTPSPTARTKKNETLTPVSMALSPPHVALVRSCDSATLRVYRCMIYARCAGLRSVGWRHNACWRQNTVFSGP